MQIYTHQIQGRRSYQEDSYFVDEANQLFVIADGMGGHPNGDLASQTVRDCFKEIPAEELTPANIEHLLKVANVNLLLCGDHRGTTALVTYIKNNRAYVFHVGDSRLYYIKDNKIHQLTEDHGRGNWLANCVGMMNMWITQYSFDIDQIQYILMCSDGVTETTDADDLKEVITTSKNNLAQAVVEKAFLDGSYDNCTAIVIKL